MSKRRKWLKKLLTCALSMTILGTAAVLFLTVENGIAITASAAETYGNFQYETENDTVIITKYTGSDKNLTIPSEINGKSVTSIGNSAFSCRSRLTSVTIPDSVKSIGDSAFYYCSSLTSVTIPNSVTSIGKSVFTDCPSLTSITIPDSVTSIGDNAFRCSVHVDKNNTQYSSEDGVLFNKNKTHIIMCPKGKSGQYIIPDSITSIGGRAFSGCSGLTSITIPDSVKSIGDSAFYYCSSLTSVTIPNSVTSIGRGAFYGCSGLTSITIPESLTNIGNYVFCNCSGLTSITIPDSVTSIEDSAFFGCRGLTSIIIPDSVTNIGDRAFDDCSSLTSVTIPDSVTSIGDAAFNCYVNVGNNNTQYSSEDGVLFNKNKTHIIMCPKGKNGQYIIPDSVTSIDNYAFSDCKNLTSITIPDSVTTIGDSAFSGCSSLQNIDIPAGVTSIGDDAFSYCRGLTNITIPDGVTAIGNGTFSDCSGLTNIIIPDNVTTIGRYAFQHCTGLKSLTISGGISSIGEGAFWDCSQLTNITFSSAAKSIGNALYAYQRNSAQYGYNNPPIQRITIENGVTAIENNAFNGLYNLTSITIPNSVTTIGDSAFSGCSSLQNIDVPAGVTSIGDDAFSYCSGLTNITIPDGVTAIGNGTFSDCSGLTNIIIPDNVTTIGRYAFQHCTGLKSLTMSGGISSIGEGAFWDCSQLTNITFSSAAKSIGNALYAYQRNSAQYGYNNPPIQRITIENGVTAIENNAFNGLYNLTSITIPNSVTTIGDGAFQNCSSLTNITIPAGVTSIGDDAFSYCNGLTNITIPDGVTAIGNGTFSDCSGLTNITIPDGVTAIGYQAFWGCTSLKSLMLPSTVTSIGEGAFAECTGLTNIIIPDGVTMIDNNVFNRCTNLTDILIPASVVSIGDYAFNIYNENMTIYGQTGSFAEQYAVNHNISFKEIPVKSTEVIAPTCTEKGYTIYHFANGTFGDYMDDYVPATGHDWNEPVYVWLNNNTTVIAVRTCNNDPTHVEGESAVSAYEVITPPTCQNQGEGKYTAEFTRQAFAEQVKSVILDKTEHHYIYTDGAIISSEGHTLLCTQCGETIMEAHSFENDVCTVCGYEKEHTERIDWSKATFEFTDGSNGLYAYTKRIISPEFVITYNGTALKEYEDYDFAEASEEESKRAGRHTIIVYDKNDETNTFSFDYYIYDLKITVTETANTINKVRFSTTRNSDKVNILKLGMILDKTGNIGENLSIDNYTHIVATTTKSISKYNANIIDTGNGVWGRPFMRILLNGKKYVVYGNAQFLTRYTAEQIAEPSMIDIPPQLTDGKVAIRVEKPIYDYNRYSCKEMGVLFNKNGKISSLEEAIANDTLVYGNVGNGTVSRGYLNGEKYGIENIDEYAAYNANISFINGNPIYTRNYIIMMNKETNEDIILYGNYYITTLNG